MIDYDAIAKTYAAYRDASPAVVQHILQALAGNQPARLLEAGCGTADHLYALAHAWKAAGFGFDLSAEMVAAGRLKNPGLELTTGDASAAFPYPDHQFDLVFSVNVIHYIQDLSRFFAEAYRVLPPGGTVLTVTDSAEDIARRTLAVYFPETVANELRRYPGIAAIQQAMETAGFTRLRLSHTERTFPLTAAHLEQYRRKAFSALRLIHESCFESGLRQMEADLAAGCAQGRELYTYVWGERG